MKKKGDHMGYEIELIEQRFSIKKENFANALKSLKNTFTGNNRLQQCIRWVNPSEVIASTTLGEALQAIRFVPETNTDGDICRLIFAGQKQGEEGIFFKALAPYVTMNSYLRFEGEDHVIWRWVFDGNTATRIFEKDEGSTDWPTSPV